MREKSGNRHLLKRLYTRLLHLLFIGEVRRGKLTTLFWIYDLLFSIYSNKNQFMTRIAKQNKVSANAADKKHSKGIETALNDIPDDLHKAI